MALAIFPATIGMALVAPEFVPLVLGSKWIGAVAPLELLALHALFRSNVILLTPLLNVIGEERLGNVEFSGRFVCTAHLILLREPLGNGRDSCCLGRHLSLSAAPVIFAHLSAYRCLLPDYLAAMWPALSGCAVMAISIEGLKLVLNQIWPLYARLALEIFIGIVAYGIILILFHREYLRGILQFARPEPRHSRNKVLLSK